MYQGCCFDIKRGFQGLLLASYFAVTMLALFDLRRCVADSKCLSMVDFLVWSNTVLQVASSAEEEAIVYVRSSSWIALQAIMCICLQGSVAALFGEKLLHTFET